MKIVVRLPNWIGDVVFALPALRSLSARFAGADIRLAGPAWAADLLAGTEFAGTVIAPGPPEALRQGAFDLAVLLTNSFSSALLARRAGIKERWGYAADGRRVLLTRAVRRTKSVPPVHMVRYYLGLLEGLGLPTLPPSIDLAVPPGAKERSARLLAEAGIDPSRPFVLLAPGAAHGPAKRWPAARFGRAAGLLAARTGASAAVIGTAADAPLAAAISAALPDPPADLTGKTGLADLLGLLAGASVLITNDSGPLHLANALRTPVVAVFGPTDPRATGPFHSPARVVRTAGIPCWPCDFRDCPYDHRCMGRVAPEAVAGAAEEIRR
jgi:heptosyltransferase-2